MASAHGMSSADAAWLRMDRPTNLMVITRSLLVRRAARLGARAGGDRDAPRRAASRASASASVESRLPLRGPRWEDDPDFDLDLHLHRLALPAPGDRRALQELVGDLMAQPLDRSRPLWHCYLSTATATARRSSRACTTASPTASRWRG